MKASFSLGGGLGDYILDYLGSPGNRLAFLLKVLPDIEFRVSKQCRGIDLLKNSPYFNKINFYEEVDYQWGYLENDIRNIIGLNENYPKITPTLWIDDEEEELLGSLSKPYGVFHPFGSNGTRSLSEAFDIYNMVQWAADASGIKILVLGQENFEYESENVKHIKGSSRLAVKIVERSLFFLGSHSSMQCAAWVYNIPSMCIGPSHLLLHNLYAPLKHDVYVKPLFRKNNVFMMYEQSDSFAYFFDYFLKINNLLAHREPFVYHRKKSFIKRNKL